MEQQTLSGIQEAEIMFTVDRNNFPRNVEELIYEGNYDAYKFYAETYVDEAVNFKGLNLSKAEKLKLIQRDVDSIGSHFYELKRIYGKDFKANVSRIAEVTATYTSSIF